MGIGSFFKKLVKGALVVAAVATGIGALAGVAGGLGTFFAGGAAAGTFGTSMASGFASAFTMANMVPVVGGAAVGYALGGTKGAIAGGVLGAVAGPMGGSVMGQISPAAEATAITGEATTGSVVASEAAKPSMLGKMGDSIATYAPIALMQGAAGYYEGEAQLEANRQARQWGDTGDFDWSSTGPSTASIAAPGTGVGNSRNQRLPGSSSGINDPFKEQEQRLPGGTAKGIA